MRYNTHLIFIVILFFCQTSFAQSNYPLHPSVGDTIESIEKLDYSLFPFIPNTGFKYGTISFQENGFYLNVLLIDTLKSFPLSKEQIIEAQQNIEKINTFYRQQSNLKEKKKKANYNADRPSGKVPVLYDKVANERIKKEARMQIRLQEDQRRMQNIPGTRQNDIIFDFR